MKLKTEKIHKTNSLFFEQINKISRPLKRIRTHTHKREHRLSISEMKEGASLQSLWELKG